MFTSKTQRFIAMAAAAASVAGVAGLTASSASAATHRPVTTTATTRLSNRPDSGGSGYWANDKLTRVLELTYQGKTGPAGFPYAYTAQLVDNGTFLDKPGQFTPNQGGHDAGDILKPTQVSGTVTGDGYFAEFFSSVQARSPHSYYNLGVETAENDHGSVTGPNFNPSGDWPQLAFPATATFSSPLSEIQFAYKYVTSYTVIRHGKPVLVTQTWTDASYNGGGQYASAGNITGR